MIRTLYIALALGLAAFYYYFIGAGPGPSELWEDLEWWRSRGWLLRWDAMLPLAELADREGAERLIPVLLFWIPPLALTIGGLLLFRNAVARAAFFWLGVNLGIIAYYGTVAERVWRFFEWRFIAVAASLTAVVTVCMFAPSLLRALVRLPRALVAAIGVVLAAGLYLLQTEVTGTDPDMRFNISPWPVVTVFGLLFFGYAIASWHVAAGAGLWLSTRISGTMGAFSGVLVAAALAAAAFWLFVFSEPPVGVLATCAAIAAVYALAVLFTSGGRTALVSSGVFRVTAGLLIAALIWGTDSAARSYQVQARNETAQVVLLALEAYKKDKREYPERLKELVPDYLEEVPRPRIGLILDEDDEFTYSNFGDSYALEFASVQWVQCAYSPPYEFAAYDEDEDEDEGYTDGEPAEEWEQVDVAARVETDEDRELTRRLREAGLEGSWNCAEEPPKVW